MHRTFLLTDSGDAGGKNFRWISDACIVRSNSAGRRRVRMTQNRATWSVCYTPAPSVVSRCSSTNSGDGVRTNRSRWSRGIHADSMREVGIASMRSRRDSRLRSGSRAPCVNAQGWRVLDGLFKRGEEFGSMNGRVGAPQEDAPSGFGRYSLGSSVRRGPPGKPSRRGVVTTTCEKADGIAAICV